MPYPSVDNSLAIRLTPRLLQCYLDYGLLQFARAPAPAQLGLRPLPARAGPVLPPHTQLVPLARPPHEIPGRPGGCDAAQGRGALSPEPDSGTPAAGTSAALDVWTLLALGLWRSLA